MRRQREPTRLTKRTVDAFACPPGKKDALLFDAALPGFAVRATAAGNKVFLLRYRAGGRLQTLKLGEYGPLTVDAARRKAEEARGMVSGGGDPKAERQALLRAQAEAEAAEREARKAEALTVRALAAAWRTLHLDPHRRGRYPAEAERTLHLGLPAWLDRPAHQLTPDEAQGILDGIALERGQAARRRTHKAAHAAFAWGVRTRRLRENPFAQLPAPMKPRPRERALSDGELGAVWRAAQRMGEPFGPFVQVLALTLQRREEVARMRWAELAPDLATWHLPGSRTKNGRPHLVHLAPAARAILRRLTRFEGSDLVFTTTGKTPVSGYTGAKRRLDTLAAAELAAAGGEGPPFPPWRLHDLRRTGVSTLARLGVVPDVADRILNHAASSTSEGVKAVYQVHDFAAEREQALHRWAAHVLEVAHIPRGAGGNVAVIGAAQPAPQSGRPRR